jgi:hypothetical protein
MQLTKGLTKGQKRFMLESLKRQVSEKTPSEDSLMEVLRAESKRPKL